MLAIACACLGGRSWRRITMTLPESCSNVSWVSDRCCAASGRSKTEPERPEKVRRTSRGGPWRHKGGLSIPTAVSL